MIYLTYKFDVSIIVYLNFDLCLSHFYYLCLRCLPDDVQPAHSNTVKDSANVLGTTASALAERTKKLHSTLNDRSKTAGAAGANGTKGGKASSGKDPAIQAVHKSLEPKKAQVGPVLSIAAFLRGASPAQQAQIRMISDVFEAMDVDKDGLISVGDVRAYFRAIGRSSNDTVTRRYV